MYYMQTLCHLMSSNLNPMGHILSPDCNVVAFLAPLSRGKKKT